ncbi:BPSS1780 family membrane protein [Catenovulum sp. 2E275]|uniref:BPSS1780 family membrane protein n=1 Tax=Catenovulum sp. 2E275 TaxID=2980497 RepID=UPI0021D28F3E|nr:BPSS1780 family membrane protein [Catenovulum sp. 2E275]MCU4674628.1 BPSS1780 family membrane protein [Catenovulum sp. 2E275]
MSDIEPSKTPRIIPTTRPAKAAFNWFSQGFSIFEKFKFQWVILTLIVYVIAFSLAVIPVFGELVVSLLMPGFFVLASVVKLTQRFEPAAFFEPVKKHFVALLRLFAINFVGAAIASWVAMSVTGGSSIETIQPNQVFSFLGIALVIYLPVMMGIAFAPALIIFDKMSVLEAFKMSFNGCFKNALSLTVFSLVLLFAMVIAVIPMGLGLLILLPVMHCTLFAMYEDIFQHKARFELPPSQDDDNQDGSFLV